LVTTSQVVRDRYRNTILGKNAGIILSLCGAGVYVVLGVGALMTILGFLGCCGAWRESPWMLGTVRSSSFIFLIISSFPVLRIRIRDPVPF
jgi:hypothetical protein